MATATRTVWIASAAKNAATYHRPRAADPAGVETVSKACLRARPEASGTMARRAHRLPKPK